MFLSKDAQLFYLRTQTYKQPSGGKTQPLLLGPGETTAMLGPQYK